jgi:hypothetical protein
MLAQQDYHHLRSRQTVLLVRLTLLRRHHRHKIQKYLQELLLMDLQ